MPIAILQLETGRGKGEWTSDNQDTAASFFLVYNPPTRGGRPQLLTSAGLTAAQHQQLGSFSADGNVVRSGTPGARRRRAAQPAKRRKRGRAQRP